MEHNFYLSMHREDPSYRLVWLSDIKQKLTKSNYRPKINIIDSDTSKTWCVPYVEYETVECMINLACILEDTREKSQCG